MQERGVQRYCFGRNRGEGQRYGLPFTRDELIDQLGVFFLAGHETTASALTWVFYMLAERPEWLARLREEIDPYMSEGDLSFEATKKLPLTRAFFKEALRLYPPITFVPRVALEKVEIEGKRLPRGALVMIAPGRFNATVNIGKTLMPLNPSVFSQKTKEFDSGRLHPLWAGSSSMRWCWVCTGREPPDYVAVGQ